MILSFRNWVSKKKTYILNNDVRVRDSERLCQREFTFVCERESLQRVKEKVVLCVREGAIVRVREFMCVEERQFVCGRMREQESMFVRETFYAEERNKYTVFVNRETFLRQGNKRTFYM